MFGALTNVFSRRSEPPAPEAAAPAIPLPDWLRQNPTDILPRTRAALERGNVVVAETNVNGDTALHIACQYGSLESARLLISAGADVHARNGRGYTPFIAAAAALNPDLLRLLIDYGADPRAKAGNGDTAIDCQFEWSHMRPREAPDFAARDMECFKLLLGCGLLPSNAWSKSLIYKEHPELSELLPEMAAARAFDKLVKDQDLPELKKTLAGGIHPDVIADYGGQAALCYAAETDNVKMIDLMLKYGAKIDRESYYRTPLQAAVIAGARKAVTRLLEAGANPDLLYTSDRYPDTTLLELARDCKKDPGMFDFVKGALQRRAQMPAQGESPKLHPLLQLRL
jgi:hypothetical protein